MKHSEVFFGAILSVSSMELWNNLLVSVIVAFLGGMAAAAGKKIHERIYMYIQNRGKKKK